MASGSEKFGEFVRRERGEKEIGLREMAKMIGVSPTYLSKVERDEFPPPAEDKVRKIAEIIKQHPRELGALLRTTKGLTADAVAKLAHQAQKVKDK